MDEVALPFRVVAAGEADIGRGRMHNEDTVLLRPDLHLYLLADGAGGHEAGNVASALATTTVAHFFEESQAQHDERPEYDESGYPFAPRRLSAAVHRAHKEIVEVAKASNRHHGMGTTLVALWLDRKTGMLHVAHVGDSRCYRLRNRQLEPLTHDHSLLNEVIEMRPDLDAAVIAKLPRHVVTRALGMNDSPVRVELRSYEPLPGDKYLLCSDGLHGFVPALDIGDALAIERTPEEQVRLLIEMAKEAGSRDNVSAVVVECDPLPNVSLRPRPSPERPRKSVPLPAPPTEDSSPEIVVMEEWPDDGSPFSEQIHVAPAPAKSRAVIDAMGGFIGPMRPRPRGQR